jgi:hypothetical protein
MTTPRIPPAAPAVLGLLLAGANAAGLAGKSRSAATHVVAVELAVCYAVYVGFALVRRSGLPVEISFAAVGIALAGVGIWTRQPGWIALGWILHGGWDLLHRHDRRHAVGVPGVPAWYIPLCAFYDFPVAVSVLVMVGVW